MFHEVLAKRCVDGLRVAEYLSNVWREKDDVCSLHVALVGLSSDAAWS